MKFIPQALADPASRSVLFVWHDGENFHRHWADKVKTVDAPGVPVHPRLVKAGDIIDWFATGWNRGAVQQVDFVPDSADLPSYHRCGTYAFKVADGFMSVRVDGRNVTGASLYIFKTDKEAA